MTKKDASLHVTKPSDWRACEPAGVEIADDGTFLFREAVRINFGHLVAQQFDGDVVKVSDLVGAVSGWLSLLQFDLTPVSPVVPEWLGQTGHVRPLQVLIAVGCGLPAQLRL